MIRFAESAAAFLAVSLLLYLGVFVGRLAIFPWLVQQRPDIGAWLTTRFFFVRNGLIYVALTWLSWRFVRHDRAPDRREVGGGPPAERLGRPYSIPRGAA